jgi:steroid 5-alpha reductase family enzyme
MSVVPLLGIAAVAIFMYVTLWFFISLFLKRSDVADIAWGLGIALVGYISSIYQIVPTERITLLLVLVAVWGLRLSVRIYLKNRHKKEDPRYTIMSEKWGKWTLLIRYLQVFVLQGALMLVIGYPFIHASVYDQSSLGALTLIGLLVWIIGFIFEALGDYQLDEFLKKPENKGKIMRYGLWKYSRHPNYFGEVTMWWGMFIIILEIPLGIWAIVSPLMITFLILKVSGIPMLEKMFDGQPEFEEYKKTTSAFFPMLPRGKN